MAIQRMITFSNLGQYGRLGNQMFQIASVIGIAGKNGHDYIFPEWKYTPYMRKALPTGIVPATKIDEVGFHYNEFKVGEGAYDIVGYLQSWKYFDHVKDTVNEYFTLSDGHKNAVDSIARSFGDNTCSIHVRRTDYVNLAQHHPVMPVAYYTRAMEIMGDCTYVVFSDDIAWCRENFVGGKFVFVHESHPDIYDMMLMAKCKHNIIANSSFSWWGAYLNGNPDKKVIAPAKWFGPAYDKLNTHDLLPENWSKI